MRRGFLNFIPFPTRFPSLADVASYIAAACRNAGIGDDVRLRAELVIEELFVNTVRHGHGGECDHQVWIAAHGSADGLEIEYRDDAPAFDPLNTANADIERAIAERTIGGLGLHLVRSLSSRGRYRHADGLNCTTLFFAADATPRAL